MLKQKQKMHYSKQKQLVNESQRQELAALYRKYAAWVRDGKKPYGYGEGKQNKYDNYHDCIYEIGEETDRFRFSIQTFDSPEGDWWWEGEFKFDNGMLVVLKSESVKR